VKLFSVSEAVPFSEIAGPPPFLPALTVFC